VFSLVLFSLVLGRDVMLTTHPFLVPRLIKSRSSTFSHPKRQLDVYRDSVTFIHRSSSVLEYFSFKSGFHQMFPTDVAIIRLYTHLHSFCTSDIFLLVIKSCKILTSRIIPHRHAIRCTAKVGAVLDPYSSHTQHTLHCNNTHNFVHSTLIKFC
jgi:hypothetical protein